MKSHVYKHAPHEKKLESVKVIGPISLQNEFNSIISDGILFKTRKIYALQNHDVTSNAYPKQFTIKFRNLPHFFSDTDVISACNLKDFKLSKLRHQLEKLSEEIETYTGICYADVEIQDEAQLQQLISWNETSFLNKYYLEEIPFKCQIQILLQCDFCKQKKLQFLGHHVRQCKAKKTQLEPESEEDSISTTKTNEEKELEATDANKNNPEHTFYIDLEKCQIRNIHDMDELHKGFSKLLALQECKPVNVLNDNNIVINQLRHVKNITEEKQRKLFKQQNIWGSPSSDVPIKNFSEFCELRGKLDVFYDSTKGEETLYLMNLSKKVTHIFKKKQQPN